jgi:hypothetical protein
VKKNVSLNMGVCGSCQGHHPVQENRAPDLAELPDETKEVRANQGPEFVMTSHDTFGQHCDGTGEPPVTVFVTS